MHLTGKNSKKIGQGTATRTGNIEVNWVQLWGNGPKFAEYNVGAASASECGGYYCRGKTIDKDPDGYYDHGSGVLKGTYDTATNLWGDNWRMPTMEELQDLVDNCGVEWVNVNGVKGCKFTGKAGSSCENNSVFLPSAGSYNKEYGVESLGSQGYYWSSTPMQDYTSRAYGLHIYSSFLGIEDLQRFYGYSVRAGLAE